MNLDSIQRAIRDEGLDGWLFFDHHQRDPLAYRVLGLPTDRLCSRRWYYFIPANGEPRKLVHKIEPFQLDPVPGAKSSYAGWEQQKSAVASLVRGAKRIAMQYSPECAVPYVSMVDGGTIELVRTTGVEILSSANLIQIFEARWTAEQLESHLEAGRRIDRILDETFRRIGDHVRAGARISEWDAQEFIKQRFAENHLFTDHGPNVSVNANSSDPHYDPKPGSCSDIKRGDTLLIDLWAKLTTRPDATYYDITWVGFCGTSAPDEFRKVFGIVTGARDRAVERVQKGVASGEALCGYHVDDAARAHIRDAGYGDYFYHRTGHSIGTEVHGNGANMDNLETHDDRRVIPGTCFSVEPGIYLPDFGIRSEVNVYVDEKSARITGAVQREPVLLG